MSVEAVEIPSEKVVDFTTIDDIATLERMVCPSSQLLPPFMAGSKIMLEAMVVARASSHTVVHYFQL